MKTSLPNSSTLCFKKPSLLVSALLSLGLLACATPDDIGDNENAPFLSPKADGGIEEGSAEALAVLALVNDLSVDFEELDIDAALNKRAATNIIAHRDGGNDLFDDLAELDKVRFVGPRALEALLAYAIAKGFLTPTSDDSASVIFSPQELESSHNIRIAGLIDQAQSNIDIAMYSFSSAAISDAIEKAVLRGVSVRFIFETARAKDKKLEGDALRNSKSGRLERMGADVRFVNKIMHHKFLLVDGPRDNPADASKTQIASGSANWSTGGATIYDENTLFLTQVPELALKMQREFNLMWTHSRDLVFDSTLPNTQASLTIRDEDIPDNPDLDIYFTSDNFTVGDTSTTFRLPSRQNLTVSDKWVAAIESATDSIWIASGHMRLRPVAEALIAKKASNPEMDIRVYVDQQEYISFSGNNFQLERRANCTAAATTETKRFDCENKSFLWARAIGESGIDVRYKFYAYRWNFSYALQMHNKFMIIDSDELFTGSYNLSINAEHSTFENVMHLRAPSFDGVIDSYEDYFGEIFDTNTGSALSELRDAVENDDTFPVVFDSMALDYDQVQSLKALIRDNCADINTDEFRRNPQFHRSCTR